MKASLFLLFAALSVHAEAPDVAALRAEVKDLGWIVYAARSDRGDYDLFRCRPDGTSVTNLTRTPQYNEAWPQFSPDGKRLLYRRLDRKETVDGNRHGEQGAPVVSQADGSAPDPLGDDGDLPWARWSPDGTQLLCLAPKGFSVVDLATKKVLRTLPRKGFFQQPAWSPDGKQILGVANNFETSWSVARMDLASGEASAVNVQDCCTPDWFPDSRNVIFSWKPKGQGVNNDYGWTQLWRSTIDGGPAQLVYAEDGRHIYGGHVSPDGRFVLFTGNMQEDGDSANAGAPMHLMRLADAPIIRGDSPFPRAKFPNANAGPLLDLPQGWEPCWTAAKP